MPDWENGRLLPIQHPGGSTNPIAELSNGDVMTAQIIDLIKYRKAKASQEVRKAVRDYFAEHSKAMVWWLW